MFALHWLVNGRVFGRTGLGIQEITCPEFLLLLLLLLCLINAAIGYDHDGWNVGR